MEHLFSFDDELVKSFKSNPTDYVKLFESAVETIYKTDFYDEFAPDMEASPKFQVQVFTTEIPKMLRELQSDLVGKLICIRGIITSTSKTNIRARKAVYQCVNCGHEHRADIPFGLFRAVAPAICANNYNSGPDKQNCKLNSYVMNTDKCEFVDQQIIKL
jgi:DNA replicative helicase MCM subunit Mcm2 (Cdc46/Mcm family)